MNLYRVYYWVGSCTTEEFVRATTEQEARLIFKKRHGDKQVISVGEVDLTPVQRMRLKHD